MRGANPDHIRRRTHAVLILCFAGSLLAACSLFVVQGHRRSQAADSAWLTLFDALADQVASMAPAGNLEGLRKWSEQQAGLPQVWLLAVYDEEDRPLTVACPEASKRQALTDLWERRPAAASGAVAVELPDQGEVEVRYLSQKLVSHSAQPAYLRLLLVGAPDPSVMPPMSGRAWRVFYGPVAGFGMVALLVSLVWVDRRVLKPLMRFLAVSRRALPNLKDAHPDAGLRTMSGLLEAVENLQAENILWREKASQLSRTVDRRVDATTRHIARQLRQASKQAATDPLTGLGNRRGIDENLGALLGQSLDAGVDLSLVLIDLDRFKELNDTHGHEAGDEALRFVGGLLSGCMRKEDLAVRLGGDEFVLLLPGLGANQAGNIARRLIALFGQRCGAYELSPPLSMSAGIVSLMEHPTRQPKEFLERADRALYAAKQLGGSQAEVYTSRLQARVMGC